MENTYTEFDHNTLDSCNDLSVTRRVVKAEFECRHCLDLSDVGPLQPVPAQSSTGLVGLLKYSPYG